MKPLLTSLGYLLSGVISLSAATAHAKLETHISYLAFEQDTGPVLSNIIPRPEDEGIQGAVLGIKDSNTTGRFLKQHYQVDSLKTDDFQELSAKAKEQYVQGVRLFVVDLPTPQLLELTDSLGKDVLVFNAANPDNKLRTESCRNNLLHTYPSRAMLADALGQWLKARRLDEWLLITGSTAEDKAYAESIKRSAKRYGHKIVADKEWTFDSDLRRNAQKEVPLFTQTDEYDVVVVADERGDFGEYILYNTWYPRPVAGTQGLTPVAWHRVVEQWGAAQLQSRFIKLAERDMNDKDYGAWAAVRSISEAVTRTKDNSAEGVRNYLASEDFQLAGFKGRKLTYRPWSGQLRQPIPLVHPRSLVSQSPQEGFLHPKTELDTLGFDDPESRCNVLNK